MLYNGQSAEECCGCNACCSICPCKAVTMKQDRKGFYYPEVNEEVCIHCGLCRKVCPMNVDAAGTPADPEVYAARSQNQGVLQESSSGGVFSHLMKWSLSRGGTVYGAAFDENFHVCHLRAETAEEAIRLRTSKYVDSEMGSAFRQIEQDLNDGRYVVVSGRPCQICAVNQYLSFRKVNTEKLLTCDVVCHGVPSSRIWEDYLNIIKRKYMAQGDRILSVNMRSKKETWKRQAMEIKTEQGLSEEIVHGFSFNRFYLSLYGNRPSCFRCHFTSYRRMGDISLGDFWNVENAGVKFDTEKGVNAVLVNTEKGRAVFEEAIRQGLDWQSVSKEAVWQPHLEYSAKRPKKQDDFWEAYCSAASDEEKESILREYMKGSALTRLIRILSPMLRKTGLYAFAGKMYKKVFVGNRHE